MADGDQAESGQTDSGQTESPGGGRIGFAVDGGVATLTIDWPGSRNALVPEMAEELVRRCEEIDADPQIGAAVVRGAGGTFCSGAARGALDDFGADPAHPEAFRQLGAVYTAFVRVGSLAVPTIAAMQGAAVGAGVNLLFATDLRIVAEDARIIAGFLKIGLHPGGGHFVLTGRTAGREAAAAMALFSEEVSGTRAVELGLAWQALPADQVDARAAELAARAARDPELARTATRSFRAELGAPGMSWDTAVSYERASQMWSLRRKALLD